jgi:transposase-like protein
MDDSIKRWTAKRKTALVIEVIQGKTTVAEASRSFDLSPSEIEGWIDDAKRGMELSKSWHQRGTRPAQPQRISTP